MKVRQGFVSNSSSSSFVIALPKTYIISDEEMAEIRETMQDYDAYFEHYEQIAEDAGETELLDERERIQKQLEAGKCEEMAEIEEPVTDKVMDADIQKAFEFLTTTGYFLSDEIYGDETTLYAAKAIVEVLNDKIVIGSTDTTSDAGQVINVLADDYINSEGMKLVYQDYVEELKKEI